MSAVMQMFFGSAREFLGTGYYLWHHAMKWFVPKIMIPWPVLENRVCKDTEPVVGLIQISIARLKSACIILRYSSLKDVGMLLTRGKNMSEQNLWVCPKCKRSFKRKDQSHYCGEKPKTIDEYIEMQDEDRRPALLHIRAVLAQALPDAEERISWSMPTFWKGHNILHFAASKQHIGFYPGVEAVEHFAKELSDYKTSKGTIRIPYEKIEDDLIAQIAKWCLETDHHA